MSAQATGSFAARVSVEALDRDPYPIYARLRAEEPVAWVPAVGMWLATRWAEAVRVASEPGSFAADMPGSPIDRSFGSPTILTCDGEVHQELRQGVGARLRPREVEGYVEELIGPTCDRLLEALLAEDRDGAELMAEYLEPVSVLGLGALLGLGDLDAATLRRWFAGLAEGATNFERDPSKQATCDAACAEIDEAIGPRLARLAAEPDDSLISHMLHEGMPDGESRSPELVMPSLKVLLLGGMQEPGHGAGTVLFCLLTHPEQLADVRADLDALLPAAIEEGMRWAAPIGTQGRRTTVALELGGVALPADAPVAAVLASANRDEARFEDGERFDLHRTRQRAATFGFGPHFCSGHAFARGLERIALRRLLERAPHLALAPGEAVPFSGWEFRAPRALPVRWCGVTG
ncbi:MAG: cytochrome P450 [Solirubrobacterales bacterium]|nr:cytochrome P450 [Solirubrobacterales bacterium]